MSDKRSVSTGALETLGSIIDENQKRDAIHLAVEPVRAGEKLYAGDHVMVKDGIAFRTSLGQGLGIVDPFLQRPVQKEEMFWFVMYPRKVTSLRHVWSHPAFPEETTTGKVTSRKVEVPAQYQSSMSKTWLIQYAITIGVSYEDLMEGARQFLVAGEYLTRGEEFQNLFTVDEFWSHYEKVAGVTVSTMRRGNFFACSCG